MLCGGFVAVMYWRVGNLNTSTSHHLNLTSHHLNISPLQPVYVLLECSHAQHLHFLLCEETPVAAAEVLLGESCELHAVELNDAVAEVLEDAAYDAVLAAVDLDAYQIGRAHV